MKSEKKLVLLRYKFKLWSDSSQEDESWHLQWTSKVNLLFREEKQTLFDE